MQISASFTFTFDGFAHGGHFVKQTDFFRWFPVHKRVSCVKITSFKFLIFTGIWSWYSKDAVTAVSSSKMTYSALQGAEKVGIQHIFYMILQNENEAGSSSASLINILRIDLDLKWGS